MSSYFLNFELFDLMKQVLIKAAKHGIGGRYFSSQP